MNSSVQLRAATMNIRDEYERRRQAMEMDLRAELRHIRSEMSHLRNLIDASDDFER